MTKSQAVTSETETLFAELLLPVPLPTTFTYRIPAVLNDVVGAGQRAIVQFGDRRILTGVIIKVHSHPPKGYEAKSILELLDDEPVVIPQQQALFSWIADYYLCTPGEVLQAALPAGLKLSSESMVQKHPSFDWETTVFEFTAKERELLLFLGDEPKGYSVVARALGVKNIFHLIKSLTRKEAIMLFEEVNDKYQPKKEKRVRLAGDYATAVKLEALFETLGRKPKQESLLLTYLQQVPVLQDPAANEIGVSKSELLAGDVSVSALNTLVKNAVMEEFEVVKSRFETFSEQISAPPVLNDDQQYAHDEILRYFEENKIVLLHGVTGSGKTELYIHLIQKALESGSQVLYLLPEIALTTQIVQRLRKIFGQTMGIYHSRFSDNERVEIWRGVLEGRLKFVVGVRSSIFLPFDNLGLVVVDEEHDASYKQQDPAPRYNARDAAMMLGQFHHARILLGSATPSVETIHQARTGRYGYVRMDKRYGGATLPEIVIADIGKERKQKTLKGEFTKTLTAGIDAALSSKEQVILFQNRRGYSPVINCNECGWVPKCVNCAVSLTYHQYRHSLVCHYCGYREQVPGSCPSCGSTRLLTPGYGTEKLEEELTLLFESARVRRMDLDTTRSKTSYDSILDDFSRRDIDILVGTQMVTKGLDFDHVTLVGIFNADRMMHFPDFRSFERAYQLITQVSGRAGRRDKQGKVIIQTNNPSHPLLASVLSRNQEGFYDYLIADRHEHGYPPFVRLIEITVKHKDKNTSREVAIHLAEALKETRLGITVLGPGEPMVSRIRNQYLHSILLKIKRGSGDLGLTKQTIAACVNSVSSEKGLHQVRIAVDVDPV